MTAFRSTCQVKTAEDFNDEDSKKQAKEEMDALTLFRTDMGTYVRFYTSCPKSLITRTRLTRSEDVLQETTTTARIRRDIPEIDLSKVVLTHHHLRNQGLNRLDSQKGSYPNLGTHRWRSRQDKTKSCYRKLSKNSTSFTGTHR